jgi:hypothetical protein
VNGRGVFYYYSVLGKTDEKLQKNPVITAGILAEIRAQDVSNINEFFYIFRASRPSS